MNILSMENAEKSKGEDDEEDGEEEEGKTN